MVELTRCVCFLFFEENCWCSGPRLCVVFRWLLHRGSFPACWRQANIEPFPTGNSSSPVANYISIFITPVLHKVCVWTSGICSSWTMYEMHWSASSHPVCVSVISEQLWCTIVCTCLMHCKLDWRVGRRLGLFRLSLVHPLIGPTINEIPINFAL